MNKETRDHVWWENFWRTHPEGYGKARESLIMFAKEYLQGKTNLSAVDIASGDGRYAVQLAKIGYDVSALEYAGAAVDIIQEKALQEGVDIRTEQGDFILKLKEQREYDLVLCSGLLEEIEQSHHEKVVQGFMNWTRPGGINIIKYCVWIKGRGELSRPGLSEEMYVKNNWNIIYCDKSEKPKETQGGVVYDKSIQKEVLTETLVAIKPI